MEHCLQQQIQHLCSNIFIYIFVPNIFFDINQLISKYRTIIYDGNIYISQYGIDEPSCGNINNPCGILYYALSQDIMLLQLSEFVWYDMMNQKLNNTQYNTDILLIFQLILLKFEQTLILNKNGECNQNIYPTHKPYSILFKNHHCCIYANDFTNFGLNIKNSKVNSCFHYELIKYNTN